MSGTSQAQWQVALQALSGQAPPLDLATGPRATDAWNQLFAASWPAWRAQEIDSRIEAELRKQLGALTQGSVVVRSVRDIALDTTAPPKLYAYPAGALQRVYVELPGQPGAWHIGFTADVDILLGTFPSVIALTVRAEARDVRVTVDGALDVSSPARPAVAHVGSPQVALRLDFTSPSPILSQVLPLLTQVLDPVIRAAILVAGPFAQQQLGQLASGLNVTVFGAGSAPTTGAPNGASIDLQATADELSDVVHRDHFPWATILVPILNSPTYGSGAALHYDDHGDSAGWTGSYLSAESMRYDVTGDARALQGAEKAVDGLLTCLEVGHPGDGYLARCAIPMADPGVGDISWRPNFFTGLVDGVLYGAIGDMSRDHYIMAAGGLTQAYLRVPELRARAQEGMTRIVDYLVRMGFNVEYTPGSTRLSHASPFGQAPMAVLGFIRSAFTMDPVRYQALHAQYEPLSE
ncbi:MAG: hypothetical protein ACYS22_06575, partial [Planctomycetota bacterium]